MVNLKRLNALIIYIDFRLVNIRAFSQNLNKQIPISNSDLSKTDSNEIDQPLKYYGSPAELFTAKSGRSGKAYHDWPDYQPIVINASIAIFLIYFCVLREENDIDLKLSANLYDTVGGLEVANLKNVYEYNLKNDLPVDDIKKRLIELGEPIPKTK